MTARYNADGGPGTLTGIESNVTFGCPFCGEFLITGAPKCAKCKAALDWTSLPPRASRKTTRAAIAAIGRLLVLGVVLLGLVGFFAQMWTEAGEKAREKAQEVNATPPSVGACLHVELDQTGKLSDWSAADCGAADANYQVEAPDASGHCSGFELTHVATGNLWWVCLSPR